MTFSRLARALVPAATLLCGRSALAGSFDAQGNYAADPDAVFRDDFDDGETVGKGKITDDPTALTGGSVLSITGGPGGGGGGIAVTLPAASGSYVARVWTKQDALVGVTVSYGDGGDPGGGQLFPTGRVTSDGWLEVASAPFSVDASRTPAVSLSAFSFGGGAVLLDALEVVPQGDFRAARACAAPDDGVCDSDELCIWRTCHDARGYMPPMPADPTERNQLVDYLAARMQALFGPWRGRHEYLPDALASVASMKTAANNVVFWKAFAAGLQLLHDSHTTVSGTFTFRLAQGSGAGHHAMNACFVIGDGDLSHALVPADDELPDVVVSHIGTGGGTWGLLPGDRLVSVDGQHPLRWAKSLVGYEWDVSIPDDPASPSQLTEDLRSYVDRYARTIEVIHCDSASGACDPPRTLVVADQADPPADASFDACDHRPLVHVPGAPADHDNGERAYGGVVLDSTADEGIYGLTWDSLLGEGSQVQTDVANAVKTWKTSAKGVILDHRTGNGGTADVPAPILAFAIQTKYDSLLRWRSVVDEDAPATLADGLALATAGKNDVFASFSGSSAPRLDVPVALLVTRDVSQSDYFSHAMKGSPNVRLFGPHPTNGAFSSIDGLTYWSAVSYTMASGDTIDPATGAPLCGHGAVPDVIVLPKQSDLGAGKDTVYEAALAWVRSQLGGAP